MLATDTRELRHNGNSVGSADVPVPVNSEHRAAEHSDAAGSDEVLKALAELDAVLKENAERERELFQRIAQVRLARENGQEWKSILAGEDEPSTVQLVSTILRRQSEASGYLRRSLVVALRAEGQSIPSIAHLFGVTHQRVSNLLRRVAQGGGAPSS
jgi:hypothetical protein